MLALDDPVGAMGELEFERWVVRTARAFGWHGVHVRDSEGVMMGVQKGDAFGWPDWVFVHGTSGRTLYRELKSQRGRLTGAQRDWLDLLTRGGNDAMVWRPADQALIVETFARP